jgi:D-aminoacyl-tRNA deacylase
MRVLLQRVKKASVSVEGKIVGKIERGALLFLGVHKEDSLEQATYLAHKVAHLRIFSDSNGKMNLSLQEVHGMALVVSQFTLYGNCQEGRRPSFSETAPPRIAEEFYEKFLLELRKEISHVETGVFGAHMEVELINEGPVTFLIEAKKEN